MNPDVSVVIPVYGNQGTLTELNQRICKTLHPTEFEIIYVDDAGPDDSFSVLEKLTRENSRIKVIRLKSNLGQNRALAVGLYHASAERIVLLDADLQDPPEAIGRLLERLAPPVNIVFAGRRGHYEVRSRLVSSRIFKSILNLLSRGRLPVDAGLFVAMTGAVRDQLLEFRDSSPYLLELMGRLDCSMISVPVIRAENKEGKTGYTIWDRAKLACCGVTGPFRRSLRKSPPLTELQIFVDSIIRTGRSHNEC